MSRDNDEKEEKETTIIRQSHEETIDGWIPAGCLFFLLLMKKEGQESTIWLSPNDLPRSAYYNPDLEGLSTSLIGGHPLVSFPLLGFS